MCYRLEGLHRRGTTEATPDGFGRWTSGGCLTSRLGVGGRPDTRRAERRRRKARGHVLDLSYVSLGGCNVRSDDGRDGADSWPRWR
jgi:hypothetical protein